MSTDNEDSKSIEELEAELPEEAVEMVNAQAAAVISRTKRTNKRFYGKKNREAWIKMNRPAKIEAIEHGHAKILALVAHGNKRATE